MASQIRLYVVHPLGEGQSVPLNKNQAHYLANVMRRKAGDTLAIFNGRDGEFLAEISDLSKRGGELTAKQISATLRRPPDLWLVFAPIKKARTDFIVEKAAELGVARICPVSTDFTNSERIRQDRLQAHAVEAIEQCGGTFVPEVTELEGLDSLLTGWEPARRIMFCDEGLAGPATGLPEDTGPWAVLIGPEGGFSARERSRLSELPFAHPVSLGPRILRADTAAVAALTLWQSTLGDWR